MQISVRLSAFHVKPSGKLSCHKNIIHIKTNFSHEQGVMIWALVSLPPGRCRPWYSVWKATSAQNQWSLSFILSLHHVDVFFFISFCFVLFCFCHAVIVTALNCRTCSAVFEPIHTDERTRTWMAAPVQRNWSSHCENLNDVMIHEAHSKKKNESKHCWMLPESPLWASFLLFKYRNLHAYY